MSERSDQHLLQEFLHGDSEQAFASLLQRHIDLVYSVALRQLRGDAHLARDATQAVFCELVRNARKVKGYRTLSGWLYTTTRFVASRMQRSESRRLARESDFAMNNTREDAPAPGWNDLELVLDEAMQDLSREDREAVLLRYFRSESFSAIGAVFGASENAARMRVERALEKLRASLSRRGITCPSAALSALLTANAISAAPAGLAAAISIPVAASAAGLGTIQILQLMATTKLKTTLAVLALAGTTTGWIIAQRNAAELDARVTQLQKKAAADNRANPSPSAGAEDRDRVRAERNELMRLRAEVTNLRRQLRERPVAAPVAAKKAEPMPLVDENEAKEQLKALGIAKMNIARGWGMAFYKFAETNNGRLPADFAQAQQSFPEGLDEFSKTVGTTGNPGDGFEIVFQGRLEEIENPAQAIILRDREPFHYGADGSASRTYLFADGHSEIYKARDGNFEAWEAQRLPILKRTVEGTEPDGAENPGSF